MCTVSIMYGIFMCVGVCMLMYACIACMHGSLSNTRAYVYANKSRAKIYVINFYLKNAAPRVKILNMKRIFFHDVHASYLFSCCACVIRYTYKYVRTPKNIQTHTLFRQSTRTYRFHIPFFDAFTLRYVHMVCMYMYIYIYVCVLAIYTLFSIPGKSVIAHLSSIPIQMYSHAFIHKLAACTLFSIPEKSVITQYSHKMLLTCRPAYIGS